MRQTLFLILLALACVSRAFDTVYVPGQHSLVLPIQCDDRVDSQFVNIATDWGIVINFAPYVQAGNQITDQDSNFATGAYTDFAITYAQSAGMSFATHASDQSPGIVNTHGRDSLNAIFDYESNWLKSKLRSADHPIGHVWTGHVNSPETRAMARAHGYTYTRGSLAYSRDLYLGAYGWANNSAAAKMGPMCMLHRALIPSIPTNTAFGTLATDQAVTDTTGLWEAVYDFCTEAAGKNGFGVLNIHPGWGLPWAETESDTMVVSTVTVAKYGTGDKTIKARSRFGSNDRNDVSSYQLDYILAAMDYWDDSCYAADGVRRLCIPDLNVLMQATTPNWRNDNSSDPDDVSDWSAGKAAGSTTNDYFVSDTGLYAWDPALTPIAEKVIYIDGTGDVKAGNGTETYPLPWNSLNSLFNCTVEVTGHAAGDTLTLKEYHEPSSGWVGTWFWTPRTGNVTYDLNGLTILAPSSASTTKAIVQYDSLGSAKGNYFNHNIEWHDGTFDFAAATGAIGAFTIGNTSSAEVDSLDQVDILLKGITFRKGVSMLKARGCKDVVVDSCFFVHNMTTAGCTSFMTGEITKNALIRNSHFNLYDAGASSIVVDLNTTLEPADSLRFINNIVILGDSSPTTSAHYLLRSTNATVDTTGTLANSLRFSRNYVVNNITGASSANIWNDLARAAARPWSQFQARITAYNSGFSGTMFFPGPRASFNYLTQANDTLRFGGYAGTGANTENGNAWIGPSTYGYLPLLWTSGAIQGRPATATLAGPWEALKFVNAGILATSSATDPDTWFEIPRIYDESSLAVARSFLDAWEKWPSAAQAKVRFRVSGEPVTTITSSDSTYQTLGQLDAALTAAAETASDSLDASTWFTLPRPYNLNAAFQIEVLRAWHRTLAEANRKKIRLRVASTDFSLYRPDTTYSEGLWGALAAINAAAETASDSLDASTWFSTSRVYDMAQAQQVGVYRDAWVGWNDATRKKIRLNTK